MQLRPRTLRVMESPIGQFGHLVERVPADSPLLDLSQGAPGFPPPPEIAARIAEVAAEPDGAQYAPQTGLPKLREAFLADVLEAYGGDVTYDDVCVTAGCNQAFCLLTMAIADPGDEVVLTLPYYFNHDMWLRIEGLAPVYLQPADGVHPTPADAEALLTDRTRAIVLVTPGNPTGLVLEPDVIAGFFELAVERDIMLLVDETYRSFVPGAAPPHRLFTDARWREHLVSLHSFSKDLAIPGHRVGAFIAHPDLIREVAKIIDCVAICPPRVGQEAAWAGLTQAREWRDTMVADVARKQARFESVMAGEPGGFVLHAAGAYYGWVAHPFTGESSEAVVRRLLLEQGVLAIPGSHFAPEDPGMIRFSFANAELDRLDELGVRLRSLSS